MKKIVLAGGTGNLGKLLTNAFVNQGWNVVILTRGHLPANTLQINWVQWDGENVGDWSQHLDGAEAVINLSGKSIQCRFTEKNKTALYASRILPTQAIGAAIQQLDNKPRIWINFSGVSLFNQLSTLQDEHSKEVGNGFLANLTMDWESAFLQHNIPDVKKVILRVSPVLLQDTGFFAELLPLVKLGLGGQVADGKQWMNWIHYLDFVNLISWILQLENPSPVYHACSPNPSTNSQFMRDFRQTVGVSVGLPLPALMAKIGAFVKGVDASLLLDSVPVTTTLTIHEGFVFYYSNTEIAIKQLLNQPK